MTALETPSDTRALLELPFAELLARARTVRDETWGTRVTYSPKVFIPLTMLCRDKCGYCTFAQPPARLDQPFLEPRDVLRIARQGAKVGTHEALFTLGERPELRYPIAQEWLRDHGFETTIDYLVAMCRMVRDEVGLLPHANAGALFRDELAALLAAPGATAGELSRTIGRMRALFDAVARLCGELYRPRFDLP